MIRVNKNLLTFLGLIFLLGISSAMVLQKLSPFAVHTSYYCQSVVNAFTTPISHYIGAIPFILLFILLAVAMTKLLFVLVRVQFLKKNLIKNSFKKSSFTTLLDKLQLTDKTYLIKDKKQFAFCLGIQNPKIYISTGMLKLLTLQEVEAVLRHERYHLNNRDTLTMLVASIGESLLPFFPLISDILHNYRIEREIKADQEAVQGLGNDRPLLSVLRKLLTATSLPMVSAAAIADQGTLEPRILMLVKKDTQFKRFKPAHILISLCSVFIMSAITLSPVQAFEVHYEGKDVVMICPAGESCINACKQEYSTHTEDHSEEILYSPMK